MVVALVWHAGVPQPKVSQADAAFADLGLDWWLDLRLLLEILLLDPAGLLVDLLVVLLVRVVCAGPDLVEARVSKVM